MIYPNGGIPLEDAKELMDFAIECRKRVKEQLRKMDETFEKVDFSYSIKDNDDTIEVKTLEEIEFGNDKEQLTEISEVIQRESTTEVPFEINLDISSNSEHESIFQELYQ